MKNKIVFIMFFAILLVFSCSKVENQEITSIEKSDTKSILMQIQDASSKYKHSSKAKIPWGTILKVAGKDLSGAVTGGCSGAAAGALVGGLAGGVGALPGAMTGMTIGGVVGGVGASLYELGSSITTTSTKPAIFPGYGSSNNPFNNNIGMEHVYQLSHGYENCLDFYSYNNETSEWELDFEAFFEYTENEISELLEIDSLDISIYYSIDQMISDISLLNNYFSGEFDFFENFPLFVTELVNSGRISSDIKDILEAYYSDISEIEEIEDFLDYTTDVEDIIIDSDLEEIDKNIILAVLATTRYDIYYWYSDN